MTEKDETKMEKGSTELTANDNENWTYTKGKQKKDHAQFYNTRRR